MKFDRGRLYESSDDYFSADGNCSMRLTTKAAIDVCKKASRNNLLITRVECGIWHNPKFEGRIDCIWDGASPPVSQKEAEANNRLAAAFIMSESDVHDAFLLTSTPLTRWRYVHD